MGFHNEERRGEVLNLSTQHTRLKKSQLATGSKMFWGCFAASGTGCLGCVNGIMKSDDYQRILGRNIVASVRKLHLHQRSWVGLGIVWFLSIQIPILLIDSDFF